MSKQFICPRRGEFGGRPAEAGVNDYDQNDDSCNYCGSLDAETFMARLEAGTSLLGPTDKNYKVYVHNHGGEAFKQHYRNCYDQGAKDCNGGPKLCTHWVTRDVAQTKFYFVHLSKEQQLRFIQLLNEKKLNIGVPGRFYSLPFFIQKEVKAS